MARNRSYETAGPAGILGAHSSVHDSRSAFFFSLSYPTYLSSFLPASFSLLPQLIISWSKYRARSRMGLTRPRITSVAFCEESGLLGNHKRRITQKQRPTHVGIRPTTYIIDLLFLPPPRPPHVLTIPSNPKNPAQQPPPTTKPPTAHPPAHIWLGTTQKIFQGKHNSTVPATSHGTTMNKGRKNRGRSLGYCHSQIYTSLCFCKAGSEDQLHHDRHRCGKRRPDRFFWIAIDRELPLKGAGQGAIGQYARIPGHKRTLGKQLLSKPLNTSRMDLSP